MDSFQLWALWRRIQKQCQQRQGQKHSLARTFQRGDHERITKSKTIWLPKVHLCWQRYLWLDQALWAVPQSCIQSDAEGIGWQLAPGRGWDLWMPGVWTSPGQWQTADWSLLLPAFLPAAGNRLDFQLIKDQFLLCSVSCLFVMTNLYRPYLVLPFCTTSYLAWSRRLN